MSLIVFIHAKNEGPCVLGQVLQAHGHKLRPVLLYAREPVPADLDDVDGIVSMGGPMNVDEAPQYPWLTAEMAYIKDAHSLGLPIVGVCLGAQLIAKALGGEVAAMAPGPATPELGWANIRQSFFGTTDPLHGGIAWDTVQFHMHGQEVTKLPPESAPLAGSKACKIQAFRVGLSTYAFQYHFEWNQSDLVVATKEPFFSKIAGAPDAAVKGIAQHYDSYRRLGDRLCNNIAELLMPLDKRTSVVRERPGERTEKPTPAPTGAR